MTLEFAVYVNFQQTDSYDSLFASLLCRSLLGFAWCRWRHLLARLNQASTPVLPSLGRQI